MTPRRIILDTDIGTDVDDAWALATVLGSPELDLLGVTTVYGNTTLRGSLARKLLRLAGRADIPVAIGHSDPFPVPEEPPPIYWPGHEGHGVLRFDGSDPHDFHPQSAVDFIIDMSHRYPGELVLVGIGPLTNIAHVLKKDPAIGSRLQGIVFMGGGYTKWNHRTEHNFKCDPQAAKIVLYSGIPLKMVGYDLTQKCRFSWKELTQLTSGSHPFAQALRTLTDVYIGILRTRKPSDQKYQKNPYTLFHDPLAVATIAHPGLVHFRLEGLFIKPTGKTTPVRILSTPAPWSVSLEIGSKVSLKDFKQFVKLRLQTLFASR